MGSYFSKPLPESAPLLECAIRGDLGQCKILIGKYIASCDDSNSSVRDQLSRASHTRVLFCPKIKAFVNRADKEGNTALIGAAFQGHTEICQFLLEKCGADLLWKNKLGCSAFWIAAGYGHLGTTKYLLDLCQRSNLCRLEDVLLQVNNNGDTPFLAAVSRGHESTMSLLLDFTSNQKDLKKNILAFQNQSGDTALSVAIGSGQNDDLIKLLLQAEEECFIISEKEDRPLFQKSKTGFTPIHIASERNSKSLVELFRSFGASMLDLDGENRTPLAVAAFCGCIDVAKYILEMGTDSINMKDKYGCTPLWLAARTGNVKMVKLLVEFGADIHVRNDSGLSASDAAVKYEKRPVMDYFASCKF